MPGLSVANLEKRRQNRKKNNKKLTPLQSANALKKLVREVVANLPPNRRPPSPTSAPTFLSYALRRM